VDEPTLVTAALRRARDAGFGMSCEDSVGRLLATLAAGVPEGGLVLELGTGAGVGTAWIVSGLTPRTDVRVMTVESDHATAALTGDGHWPSFVTRMCDDGLAALAGMRARDIAFDLIFADAPAGKWDGLDQVIAALAPHGMLIVDDMTPQPGWSDEHRAATEQVRGTLLAAPELTSVELAHGSGVILGARVGLPKVTPAHVNTAVLRRARGAVPLCLPGLGAGG
jgi:predicted O-methyltransferase YrrM